jgi:hypothetical protein
MARRKKTSKTIHHRRRRGGLGAIGGGGKGFMPAIMDTAVVAAGVLGAAYLANKVLAGKVSPLIAGGIEAAGGVYLQTMKNPMLAKLGLGLAAGGLKHIAVNTLLKDSAANFGSQPLAGEDVYGAPADMDAIMVEATRMNGAPLPGGATPLLMAAGWQNAANNLLQGADEFAGDEFAGEEMVMQ